MMKRETLRETRSVVFKMDFYVDNQRHAQIIDSHLEALDKIEQLEAAMEAAKKDAWNKGYADGSLDMDNGIDKDDSRRAVNPYDPAK